MVFLDSRRYEMLPRQYAIKLFIQLVVLMALPMVYLYLYVQVFEWLHSGNFFYSEEWGSSMVVFPHGDSISWLKLNFYSQVFIEHGTSIILVSFICIPFILVFFEKYRVVMTLIYSILCTALLWSTAWPDARIPTFLNSSLSHWIAGLQIQILPVLMLLLIQKLVHIWHRKLS